MVSVAHPLLPGQAIVHDMTGLISDRLRRLFHMFEVGSTCTDRAVFSEISVSRGDNGAPFRIQVDTDIRYSVQTEETALASIAHFCYEAAVVAFRQIYFLHGGYVSDGDSGFLIIGKQNSGKSTITYRLCSLGMEYGTDDVIPVDATTFPLVCETWPPIRPCLTGGSTCHLDEL